MMDRIWYFVMVPMVYLSVAWCVIWIVVRIVGILRAPKRPSTLMIFTEDSSGKDKTGGGIGAALWDTFTLPSVRKYQPVFWVFLILFHTAVLILVLSHLDLLPQIAVLSPQSPHMIGQGAVGAVITVSLLYFLFRRFRTPVREISAPGDYLLLVLFLAAVITGDIISWGNSWTDSGFVLSKQDFGAYLESMLTFRMADPREYLQGGHYPVIGAHVLFANLLLLALPFSKIMHVCFAPAMNKLRRG